MEGLRFRACSVEGKILQREITCKLGLYRGYTQGLCTAEASITTKIFFLGALGFLSTSEFHRFWYVGLRLRGLADLELRLSGSELSLRNFASFVSGRKLLMQSCHPVALGLFGVT